MYGTDGKEDLEFRLLHVYYSAKRAVNKGVIQQMSPPPSTLRTPSPQRRMHDYGSSFLHSQQPITTPSSETISQPGQSQDTLATAASSNSGICHSPLSFDWSSPNSPAASTAFHHQRDNIFGSNWVVTPVSDLFRRRGRPTPSSNPSLTSPISRKRSRESHFRDEVSPESNLSTQRSMDTIDMESSLQEIDSYWNDPLMSILMQPSHEACATDNSANISAPRSLPQRLTMLHEKLRELVGDDAEAATLVKEWAECLASECKGKAAV
jgi:hypothetical protein